MNILIADDSEHFRELISNTIMNGLGNTILASDGYEALQHLSNSTVDLLITDIEMPVLDGLKLTQIARSLSIPVVVMCGNDTSLERAQAEVFGASEFCVKDTGLADRVAQIVSELRGPDVSE